MVYLFGGGCAPDGDFNARLNAIVRPYRFSIAAWELRTIPWQAGQWLFGGETETDDEVGAVTEYFSSVKQIRSLRATIAADGAGVPALLEDELAGLREQQMALTPAVERIISEQIRQVLTQECILNPVTKLEIRFPPVNFKLEELPHLLVVSPRDRIESVEEVVLNQSLPRQEKETIESNVDELGVSSLVVGLGGMATYPSLVDSEASLRFTIDTIVEEWLHQYLAFKPLGFRYLLDLSGLSRNYDIATINESLAGMVSGEIGAMVYQKYYSGNETGAIQTPEPEFDFNREMREIRKTVDAYLVRGEIAQAEEFMEQRRQYLASKGYYIRKLNQAYFAFHGTYADRTAFTSQIGLELKELRSRSDSLKDFLETAAAITVRQDLTDSIR